MKASQNNGKNSNLRRWKPGESGNPGGRPKTAVFSEQVRQFLNEPVDGGSTRLRKVLERLAKVKPEVLLWYSYGKPTETLYVKTEQDMQTALALQVSQVLAMERAEKEMRQLADKPAPVIDCETSPVREES